MIDIILTQPTAIKAGFGNVIFYYGVKPDGLSKLPAQSEFTLVYSPSQDYGWEAVHYRVLHTDKTYFVVDRRDLIIDEIQHFQRLLENLPLEQSNADLSDQENTACAASADWKHWIASGVANLGNLLMSPFTLILPKLLDGGPPKP
jgi:hypothetical protein